MYYETSWRENTLRKVVGDKHIDPDCYEILLYKYIDPDCYVILLYKYIDPDC